MALLGPPKEMKVPGGKSPRLKPGVKTAPLTPGFSPGLLAGTFAGAVTDLQKCKWGGTPPLKPPGGLKYRLQY
jgi:hypothetical protein